MGQKFEAYFHLPFALINGLASLQRPAREQEASSYDHGSIFENLL